MVRINLWCDSLKSFFFFFFFFFFFSYHPCQDCYTGTDGQKMTSMDHNIQIKILKIGIDYKI